VERVVLSCSYLVNEIRQTMGDGSQWGVALEYAVETEPLGTAGGVRNAADLVSGLVVVLNGDILTDADVSAMLRFHTERGSRATLYLTRVEDTSPYGLVDLAADGGVKRFVEKPGPADRTTDTINAGIYVLDASLLGRIPPGRVASMEREFFPGLLADSVPCFGWVDDGYWIDIGSPAKYRQAHLDLLGGLLEVHVGPARARGAARAIAADAIVGARAETTPPVVIGAGCRLEPDSRVGPASVLGPGCVVGAGAAVEGAVLWERVAVGPGAVLRDCILGADVRVGPHAQVAPGTVLEDGAVVA
jgi:NDP-sugar pyrophosphorylase family protein